MREVRRSRFHDPCELLRFLPFDDFGLVRALHFADQESIRTRLPHLGKHVDRYVFRVGRREIADHIEDKLGIRQRGVWAAATAW